MPPVVARREKSDVETGFVVVVGALYAAAFSSAEASDIMELLRLWCPPPCAPPADEAAGGAAAAPSPPALTPLRIGNTFGDHIARVCE